MGQLRLALREVAIQPATNLHKQKTYSVQRQTRDCGNEGTNDQHNITTTSAHNSYGGKKSGEEENELLLKDVETINKALYKEKSSSRNSTSSKSRLHDPKSKPKASKEDNLREDKKSLWGWKPLKALSLTRNKSLCVHWKRRDALLVTPPAKVIQDVAEFRDILTHTCPIYGSRSGPHNSAKYEAKHFLLYATMLGAPELDLGKHRVDVTRLLLPLTLE
ncbi:hypothetical protein E2542_SST18856 [Spatholobus suberectus]|nr:hypothetical protein E2542_SST18856 [Spatholobus suberectus]